MSFVDAPCSHCGASHAPGGECNVDPVVGSVLGEKYQVVRVLGEGGMGKVYEARHRAIGRRVAIKFLRAEFAYNASVVRRFENEARAAGGLEHENIAAVHDFGRAPDGSQYLVMEFLSGEDCSSLLEREGPLPVRRTLALMLQVCRGLRVAHEHQIVHRDLKPANIFLCKRADGTDLLKILDFGIAKLRWVDTPSATSTGSPIGTAYYMSPEQARGEREVDQRSDIYSLGVILYELLSAKRPHEGGSVLEIVYHVLHSKPAPIETLRSDLPPGLSAIVSRAMAFEAKDRYDSVSELSTALERIALAQPSSTSDAGLAIGVARTVLADSTPKARQQQTPPPVSNTRPEARIAIAGSARPGTFIPGRKRYLALLAVVAGALGALALSFHSRTTPTVASAELAASTTPSASLAQPLPQAPAPNVALATKPTEDIALPAATASAVPALPTSASPARAAAGAVPSSHARRGVATAKPGQGGSVTPAPTPPAATPPAVQPAKPNCDPNFVLDAQGEKHFKPECFPH